jgi:hypothetical protein
MYVFKDAVDVWYSPGLDPDAVNRRRLFVPTLVCLFFNLNLGLR